MTSAPDDARPWRILNPRDLILWAYQGSERLDQAGPLVLEFLRDHVGADPDFGEVIDEHTRGYLVPGTDVEAIWTFNPAKRYIEIITPRLDRGSTSGS